jgi:ketopantoate reductase
MGGPEQAQAQSAPPAQAMPPGGEAPQGAQEEQDEEPLNEDDPTFKSAIDFVMQALYSAQAAKDIAKQLKSAPDLQTGMADVAYNITAIADEKTQGSLADEYLAPLAMKVLEEVVEIADAAGLQPTPESVAIAFKTMILRYLQEQGVDTTQLDQAMSQIDPAQFGGMEEQQEEQAEV